MPDPKAPFVSVIIPVYQQWDYLTLALEALAAQTYSASSFEVLVVNNEPAPGLPAPMPILRNLVLINEPQAGSYAARNTAIRASKGEILAFMDADCIPDPDWLQQGVRILEDDQAVSRVAGSIEVLYRNPQRRSAVELWISLFAWRQELAVSKYGTALTGNLFARREVFDKIGLFDETLKSGGDSDWGIRAAKAGFPIVFAPGVRVSHPARTTLAQLARRITRLHGGTWEREHGKESKTFLQKAGSFRVGTDMLRTALASPRLTSLGDRLKVLGVILFVGLVRLLEHVRLLLGGEPRRG